MEEPKSQLKQPKRAFGLHPIIRWILISFFGILIALIIWRYWCYIRNPLDTASPDKLGLPALFVFSGLSFLFFLVPWEKLGLRVKKFGFLEFENIIETQATEYTEAFSEIEERINYLENCLENQTKVNSLKEYHEFQQAPILKELLVDFFTQNDHLEYSPVQILNLISQQPGFQKSQMPNPTPALIRRVLRKLVVDRVLEIKISKTGQTLYRRLTKTA